MARKCSYSKRDLVVVCSKTKQSIKKDLESGSIDKKRITKSYVYNDIAKRLKLSSSAGFYKKNYIYYEQLENWYIEFCKFLEKITPLPTNETGPKINSVNNKHNSDLSESNSKKTNELLSKIKEKDDMINHLNKVIQELRMENESLRLSRIGKIHKLDSDMKSDILDESLDSVDIKHLYNVISKLYDSRFQK